MRSTMQTIRALPIYYSSYENGGPPRVKHKYFKHLGNKVSIALCLRRFNHMRVVRSFVRSFVHREYIEVLVQRFNSNPVRHKGEGCLWISPKIFECDFTTFSHCRYHSEWNELVYMATWIHACIDCTMHERDRQLHTKKNTHKKEVVTICSWMNHDGWISRSSSLSSSIDMALAGAIITVNRNVNFKRLEIAFCVLTSPILWKSERIFSLHTQLPVCAVRWMLHFHWIHNRIWIAAGTAATNVNSIFVRKQIKKISTLFLFCVAIHSTDFGGKMRNFLCEYVVYQWRWSALFKSITAHNWMNCPPWIGKKDIKGISITFCLMKIIYSFLRLNSGLRLFCCCICSKLVVCLCAPEVNGKIVRSSKPKGINNKRNNKKYRRKTEWIISKLAKKEKRIIVRVVEYSHMMHSADRNEIFFFVFFNALLLQKRILSLKFVAWPMTQTRSVPAASGRTHSSGIKSRPISAN